MNFFYKIINCYYKLKDKKRYKKFKNCSLPYPFYDNKRNTFEWVMYNEYMKKYDVRTSLLDSLGNHANYGVVYYYKAKIYGREKPGQERKYRLMVTHCHHFDEVIRAVYDYPETFEIPDEFLEEYSKQELEYLKQVQNYLLLIGLKDLRKSKEKEALDKKYDEIYDKKNKNLKDILFKISYKKKWNKLTEIENFNRYNNTLAREYADYPQLRFKNEIIAKGIMAGDKDYLINIEYPFTLSRLNERYFVMDNDHHYIGIIEVISEEIISFKDLKENMVNYKLAGYKNFKDYKDYLLNEFIKESEIYNHTFKEDSQIRYAKIKIIKKL